MSFAFVYSKFLNLAAKNHIPGPSVITARSVVTVTPFASTSATAPAVVTVIGIGSAFMGEKPSNDLLCLTLNLPQ